MFTENTDLTEDDLCSVKTSFPEADIGLIVDFVKIIKRAFLVINGMETFFSLHNLSRGKFQVLISLFTLNEGGGMSPADISRFHCVKSATVTGLIDGLERDGLVERKPDPNDRRSIIVSLTKSGKTFMVDFLPKHYQLMSEIMSCLDGEAVDAAVSTLDIVLKKLNEHLQICRQKEA